MHLFGIIIRNNDLYFPRHLFVPFLNTPIFRKTKGNLLNINLHSKHNTSCNICYIRLLRVKRGKRHLHIERECCFLEKEIALKLHRCSFLRIITIVFIIIIGLITCHKIMNNAFLLNFEHNKCNVWLLLCSLKIL